MASATAKRTLRTMSLVSVLGCGTWFFLIEEQLYCLINDGAACIIVTTSERARDLQQRPVYLSGMQGLPGGRDEFIWAYPGFGMAQQAVFDYHAGLQPVYQRAGVTPADIDVLFTYDAFSILVWMALERFGFCRPGEAAAFTQEGRIALGGALPMNTNGGLLSAEIG